MHNEDEIHFGGGGVPDIPPPEVFAAARAAWPQDYKLLRAALDEFTSRPENKGLYPDPEKGTTLAQYWRFFTLFGIEMHCVLVRELPKSSTDPIPGLEKQSPEGLIALLKRLDRLDGFLCVPTLEFDGRTGHCIRLTRFQPPSERFVYHDPWPADSLLTEGSNMAGVKAMREGFRWSVTASELERVVFACMFYPEHWERLTNGSSPPPKTDLMFADWADGEFRRFFHLQETERRSQNGVDQRAFAPQNFQEEVAVVIDSDTTGRVASASLILERHWIQARLPLALDIAKSFLIACAPVRDADEYRILSERVWGLRDRAAFQRLMSAGEPTRGPEQFLVSFLGAPHRAEILYPRSCLTAQNLQEGGSDYFKVTIELY